MFMFSLVLFIVFFYLITDWAMPLFSAVMVSNVGAKIRGGALGIYTHIFCLHLVYFPLVGVPPTARGDQNDLRSWNTIMGSEDGFGSKALRSNG